MPHARKIAVIGLGYVGLPVAVGFARTGASVVDFDIDAARVADIVAGVDRAREVTPEELRAAKARWTSDPEDLRDGKGVVIDIRARLDRGHTPAGIALWRL